jgi:hypothetical protein
MDKNERGRRLRLLAQKIEGLPPAEAQRVLQQRRQQVGDKRYAQEAWALEQANKANRAVRAQPVRAPRDSFNIDTGSAVGKTAPPPLSHNADYAEVLKSSGATDTERRHSVGIARNGGW